MQGSFSKVEPFLKWAGGKRWLVNCHRDIFPSEFRRYIEPFLGSGATYFGLQPRKAILGDINSELVEVYETIKYHWEEVIRMLKRHQNRHSKEYYYHLRSSRPRSAWGRAARFIYLNRTCWNGLYRVNKNGQFNVPIGTRSSVLLNSDDFESTAKLLKNAKLIGGDFKNVIDKAKSGDFIFVDPPYTVQHNYNNFVKYNEKLFVWPDQIRLKDSLVSAHSRGAKILLTNANHPAIEELYSGDKCFDMIPLSRNSAIASKSTHRGETSELIIRNYSE